MRLLLIGLVFLVAACSTLTREQQWIVGCESYAALLTTLAAYRSEGRLSERTVETVDRWRPRLNAICEADAPPTSAELFTELQEGLLQLALAHQEGSRQ